MDSMFTLGVLLSVKDLLSPAMEKAKENAGEFSTKIQAVSGKMAVLGTASYATGRAMLSPVINTLHGYQDLAKAQGEIASLGITATGIDSITKSAKEFSNQFAGTTATDFVSASYDIKSGIATLSDTAVGEFTKIAAMTGTATKSSTGQMTSLFATGYGIYRKQFEQFGATTIEGWNALSDEEKDIKFGEYFSAGIASSVQAFKTDGGNMSAALSSLGATATSAGISFSEQLSILGQLQATMSGSEAATKYRAFLGSVSGAGDKLGLQFTDSNNQLLSMPQIIGAIKDKYGETIDALESDELKKAFGTEEAVALVKLMYNETDALTNNINSMNVSLGEGTKKTKKMADAMNKGQEFDLLDQQVSNLSTTIGSVFAPVATKITSVLGGVVTSIQSFTEEHETATTVIGYTVAGIGALLTIAGAVIIPISAIGIALPALTVGFGMLSTAVGFTGTVISSVGAAMMANPIILVATGIAIAAVAIYTYWEPIKGFFGDLLSSIELKISTTWTWIKSVFSWSPIGLVSQSWGKVFDWFSSKFELLGSAVDNIKSIGSGISDFFGFGDDNKKIEIAKTVKNVAVSTAMATQIATAQPAIKPLAPVQEPAIQTTIVPVMQPTQNSASPDAVMQTDIRPARIAQVSTPSQNFKPQTELLPIGMFENKEKSAEHKNIDNSTINNSDIKSESKTQSFSKNEAIQISISFGDVVVNAKDGEIDPVAIQQQIDKAVHIALRNIEDNRRNRSYSDEDM